MTTTVTLDDGKKDGHECRCDTPLLAKKRHYHYHQSVFQSPLSSTNSSADSTSNGTMLLRQFLGSLFHENGVVPSNVSIVEDNPQSLTSLLIVREDDSHITSLDDFFTSNHSDNTSLSPALLRRKQFLFTQLPSPSMKVSTKEQERWDSMSSSDSCLFAPPKRKTSLTLGRHHYHNPHDDSTQGHEDDECVWSTGRPKPSLTMSLPLELSMSGGSTSQSHLSGSNSRTRRTQQQPDVSWSSSKSPAKNQRPCMVKSNSSPSPAASSVTSPRIPRRYRSKEPTEIEPQSRGRSDKSPSPPPAPPIRSIETHHVIRDEDDVFGLNEKVTPTRISRALGVDCLYRKLDDKDGSPSCTPTSVVSFLPSSCRHDETVCNMQNMMTMPMSNNQCNVATSTASTSMEPVRRDSFLATIRMLQQNGLPQSLPGAPMGREEYDVRGENSKVA